MLHRDSQTETEQISSGIARLSVLEVSELKDRWLAAYGNDPPPRSSKKLLVSAIAYKIQERAFGSLKPSVIRLLEHTSEDSGGRRTPPQPENYESLERNGLDP